MSVIERAAGFAHCAHIGQVRRHSGEPYIEHPRRVAELVDKGPGRTDEMVAAAWIHDVIEDGGILPADLRIVFGDTVTDLVVELTNTSKGTHPNASRAERRRLDHARLAKVSPEAKLNKMCDRWDNLADIDKFDRGFAGLYLKESLRLLEAIGDADEGACARLYDRITQATEWLAIHHGLNSREPMKDSQIGMDAPATERS